MSFKPSAKINRPNETYLDLQASFLFHFNTRFYPGNKRANKLFLLYTALQGSIVPWDYTQCRDCIDLNKKFF